MLFPVRLGSSGVYKRILEGATEIEDMTETEAVAGILTEEMLIEVFHLHSVSGDLVFDYRMSDDIQSKCVIL